MKVKARGNEEKEYCPVCGWELESSPAGIWCVNPDCKVWDDADNYKEEGKHV